MGRIRRQPGTNNNTQGNTNNPSIVPSLKFHTSVLDKSTGLPINDAFVSIHVDNDLGEFHGVRVNENGYYRVEIPPSIPRPYGADLNVAAEGYGSSSQRVLLPKEENYDLTGGVRIEQTNLFPGESGRVLLDGIGFYNNGSPWVMRAATMFMLFARYVRGEDITPTLAWARRNGFNTLRVLGPVDWPEWPDYRKISNWDKLYEFFTLAGSHGLRILWVPITTKQNANDHLELLGGSLAVANRVNNVMLQVCNEPLKDGKCDPVDLLHKVGNRGQTLVDYGIYWADNWPSVWPIADFGSVHLTREYPKFSRKSKDLLELRNAFRAPFIHDEPIGVAEADIPGRRTTDSYAVCDDAAIALLCGNGWCYHFESGIQGLPPLEGSNQEHTAQSLAAVFGFIPSDTHRGNYTAPHVAGFPMRWSDQDSLVGHAYGMIIGNTAYVVNPMPSPEWVPFGINGWRIEESLLRSIFKLVR